MVDTHTHIELCDGEPAEVVARAREAGVTAMLDVGLDDESARGALARAEEFDDVWAAVGRHPTATAGFGDADQERLARLAEHPRCVAIGETGLDFYREGPSPGDQERAFLAQIELARAFSKALVIHSRAAEDATIEILTRHAADLTVVMHCFSMPARLGECLDAGWMLSFAGNTTYPSAADVADAVEQVPADRLLLETDAPYLTPVPLRGERNEPANVLQTAQFIAARRGQTLAQLQTDTDANAARTFGW